MPTKKTTAAKKKTAAKKVVKKTANKAVKKTTKKATKTSVAKPAAGKVLVCAKDSECFWTTDGEILQDLTQLRDALGVMSDDVFTHHVTKEKNDFADWVEHVLYDGECAAALRKSRKPNTARTTVVKHLRYYNV